MKIIALLPVKNEAWILPTYLSSVMRVADEIVALDDGSTDSSRTILEAAGASVFSHDFGTERIVQMSARRTLLLEEGRRRGGTHFIWLDADEAFSLDFLPLARETIASLKEGEKLSMRWVHLWKNTAQYLDDPASPFGHAWKDVIVCDSPTYSFETRFLSEARTPGPHDKLVCLPEEHGVVLHFQFAQWDAMQMKQAWYRCMERIEGSRSARRINHTYSVTLDAPALRTLPLPTHWIEGIVLPSDAPITDWREEEISSWFDTHGILFFEPLQIWHIPSLRKQFVSETSREPVPRVFPRWLLLLNRLRNALRATISA